MKQLHTLLVFVGLAATVGCYSPPDPESCDLDVTFSTSKQFVNCSEDIGDPGQFRCDCPDGTFFKSAETCEKPAIEQGELIDRACPVDEETDGPSFG